MSILSRASTFEAAVSASDPDVFDLLASVERGDAPNYELSAHRQQQFAALSAVRKDEALARLAKAPPTLTAVILDNLQLGDVHAEMIANLIKRPSLLRLSLERNNLGEVSCLRIADALESTGGTGALEYLSVAEQRNALSTRATLRLLDAMSATPSLQKLGLGSLRDEAIRKRHQEVTMAAAERKREARRKQLQLGETPPSTPSASTSAATPRSERPAPTPTPPRRVSNALLGRINSLESVVGAVAEEALATVDWAEEARRIAASDTSSAPPLAGMPAAASTSSTSSDSSSYSLLGNGPWLKATEEEKRAVIDAFATNRSLSTVVMANCALSDALGVRWGRSLQTNRALTSLNLESNSIGSSGLEAVAEAMRQGGEELRLRELKLANQRIACGQRSEESIAEALEHCPSIVKLTMDLRSTRARDLINKYVTRHSEAEREENKRRRSSFAESIADAASVSTSAPERGPAASCSGRSTAGESPPMQMPAPAADGVTAGDATDRSRSDGNAAAGMLDHAALLSRPRCAPASRRSSRSLSSSSKRLTDGQGREDTCEELPSPKPTAPTSPNARANPRLSPQPKCPQTVLPTLSSLSPPPSNTTASATALSEHAAPSHPPLARGSGEGGGGSVASIAAAFETRAQAVSSDLLMTAAARCGGAALTPGSMSASPDSSVSGGGTREGDDDDSTGFRLVRCLCGEACARRLVGLWSGQSARKPLLSPAVRSTNGCGSDDEAWSLSDASRRPRGSGLHRRSGNGSSPTHENTREMESAPNPEEEFV